MYHCNHPDCFYAQDFNGCQSAEKGTKFCNYCLITGEPRGCPADKCTHYEPKRAKPRKANITLVARKKRNIE